MKDNATFRLLQTAMPLITKKALPTQQCRKAVLREYRAICRRAKDIGKNNILLSSYALGAWFIAMNRENGFSPEKNYELLAEGLRNSRLFRMMMGDADHYLDPKRIKKRKKWAENTKERRYENDWVVDLLPGNGNYDLGYDYLECGVCKLCRDEGCFELAHYLCKLDFMMAEIMGLRLERTCTLADGDAKCDFRYYK